MTLRTSPRVLAHLVARLLAWPLMALPLMACAQAGTSPAASTAAPAAINAPYKDVSIGIDPAAPRIAALPLPLKVVTWAFATGECGEERWAPHVDTDAFARLNLAAYRASGTGYIVSTGGEAGIFTCASDAGMARFLARYDSPQLRGLDFDIEGQQTPAQITSLVQRLRTLQRQRPGLRLSFTLATFAASDGSQRSLNALGERVHQAIRDNGLEGAVYNLMVMNYGPPNPAHCVVKDGHCDMGASALQAARNLHQRHGVPFHQIALTAMLGENDVAGNVFTLADAELLKRGAAALGLAGVQHWSLDRDTPCPAGAPRVSPTCHALPGVPPLAFTRLLSAP